MSKSEYPVIPANDPDADTIPLAEKAREIIADRKRRAAFFPQSIFGEPAWDILLGLYADEPDSEINAEGLCSAAGSPTSTALRWLKYLAAEGFLTVEAGNFDAGQRMVALTASARHSIESYLRDVMYGNRRT